MSASSPMPVPETIGPFRIVRPLGRGAMGVVYLGERMEQFSQRVAIKMLHPQVSLLAGEQPLQREEKVLASLDHPWIVRLLDTGEYGNGLRYIVMEYVEGITLDVYCREHALTTEKRIRLIQAVATAIDYAHRRLVIHADLKPENILITAEGEPKILDFGVAILADSNTPDAAQISSSFTPAYASPEQIARGRATAATDVYSLGAIARTLLAARDGSTRPMGRDLTMVLAQSMQLEPERRYATMREFADDLAAVLEHRPVAARRGDRLYRSRRWMRRHWTASVVVFVLLLLLIGSVTGVIVQAARATRQRRTTQARLYELVQLTGTLEGELYDSAHSLVHGKDASASLLQAATATLDKLATQNGNDPVLALEIARQYGKLAALAEMQGDKSEAALDMYKGLTLINTIPMQDRNYASAKTVAAQLAALSHP